MERNFLVFSVPKREYFICEWKKKKWNAYQISDETKEMVWMRYEYEYDTCNVLQTVVVPYSDDWSS